MPLPFLLDENLRGWLWQAIKRYATHSALPIDVVRIGDAPDLPLGTSDPDVLLWCEGQGRILVTADFHNHAWAFQGPR